MRRLVVSRLVVGPGHGALETVKLECDTVEEAIWTMKEFLGFDPALEEQEQQQP